MMKTSIHNIIHSDMISCDIQKLKVVLQEITTMKRIVFRIVIFLRYGFEIMKFAIKYIELNQ